MTLREAYPYWVLGLIPPKDLPFIACNDLTAGTADDEIVALAFLSESETDTWEFDQVLARAFTRLGLSPMNKREAAMSVALERMREIAGRIVSREETPLQGANAIYWCASEAGLLEDDHLDEKITKYGTEFLQLADALEVRQENRHQKTQFEQPTIEAAQALLAGRSTPEWYAAPSGDLRRGRPPWATPNGVQADKDVRP